MRDLLIYSPFVVALTLFVIVSVRYFIWDVKDQRLLEAEIASNKVDLKLAFNRIYRKLNQGPIGRNTKIEKILRDAQKTDRFIKKLSDTDFERFTFICRKEIPALLQVQKKMLSKGFNVKNETLIQLLEIIFENMNEHRLALNKGTNIELDDELNALLALREKKTD